jgi:hypothetical protein
VPGDWCTRVTDEDDLWTTAEEPSEEDFEAAEREQPPRGPRETLVWILRLVGVLLVILALVLYLVAPYSSLLRGLSGRLRLLGPGIQPIPIAPEPKTVPKLSGVAAPGPIARPRG